MTMFMKFSRGGVFEAAEFGAYNMIPTGEQVAPPVAGDVVFVSNYVPSCDFSGQVGKMAAAESRGAAEWAASHGLRLVFRGFPGANIRNAEGCMPALLSV